VPEIEVGDWRWAGEDGDPRGDPALSHHGHEFLAGSPVDSAYLRQAADGLAELAVIVREAGW
jgi:hypothetical protein